MQSKYKIDRNESIKYLNKLTYTIIQKFVFLKCFWKNYVFDQKYKKTVLLWNGSILNNCFLFEYCKI